MSDNNKTPEQISRDRIDTMLIEAGWSVQDSRRIDFDKAKGIAVREYPTDSGQADYVLFVERRPIGVIEAKRSEMGQNINLVAEQSARYSTSKFNAHEIRKKSEILTRINADSAQINTDKSRKSV